MNENIVNDVRASYGRCTMSRGFFDRFYEIFLSKSPAIGEKFKNTDFVKQKEALRNGLTMLILFAKGSHAGTKKVNDLAFSHSKKHLDITPELYALWKEALTQTVKEFDKEITMEDLSKWNSVLDLGIKHMIAGYHD